MEFTKDEKTVGLFNRVCENCSEQPLDAEINLPDYCQEIRRIIKCSIVPNVASIRNRNGKITAEINALIRLIYVGENGKLSSFEQNTSFEKTTDIPSADKECAVSMKVNADYINCRAVSSRKADVRSMLKFTYIISDRSEEQFLSSVSGGGIQTMSEKYDFASLSSVNEKMFTVSEIIDMSDEKPPVISVIDSRACAKYDEIKIINNKILLKGECDVKIYYICSEDGDVDFAEHSMPISQIIEVEGICEEDTVSVSLRCTAAEVFAKADQSGEMRRLDISVNISAFILSVTPTPVTFITDAYSTECELKTEKKSIEIPEINTAFDTCFTNKVVLESIGVSVSRVLSIGCSELEYTFGLKDGKCCVSGSYNISVLYLDSDSQHGIIKKPLSFDLMIPLEKSAERLCCFGGVNILNCSCAAANESKLEIMTEMAVNGLALTCCIRKYISSVEPGNESDTDKKRPGLTIYFCDKGESVWNIARKYKTTVEAVMAENELTEPVAQAGTMLLIPSADEI